MTKLGISYNSAVARTLIGIDLILQNDGGQTAPLMIWFIASLISHALKKMPIMHLAAVRSVRGSLSMLAACETGGLKSEATTFQATST